MPEPRPAQDNTADDAGTPAETESGAGSETDEPAVYENRAARRAKGKGSSQPQPHGQGQRIGGRGSVQSPRQYGTRRSG
ncbi:hypothetical protein [Micromonospora sp. NPDC049679]|uniref:hypothetical protein n=1 Tax=Micromonospora sp. NPDC049679 TaxID=3155920 RepID=UPI0033C32B4D